MSSWPERRGNVLRVGGWAALALEHPDPRRYLVLAVEPDLVRALSEDGKTKLQFGYSELYPCDPPGTMGLIAG